MNNDNMEQNIADVVNNMVVDGQEVQMPRILIIAHEPETINEYRERYGQGAKIWAYSYNSLRTQIAIDGAEETVKRIETFKPNLVIFRVSLQEEIRGISDFLNYSVDGVRPLKNVPWLAFGHFHPEQPNAYQLRTQKILNRAGVQEAYAVDADLPSLEQVLKHAKPYVTPEKELSLGRRICDYVFHGLQKIKAYGHNDQKRGESK
jgi:hypothetical protein